MATLAAEARQACLAPAYRRNTCKAIEGRTLLESGEAANQAEIARCEGLTRARVTQVMGLLRLVPEIQRHILSMPKAIRRPPVTERALRPIANLKDRKKQLAEFSVLLRNAK